MSCVVTTCGYSLGLGCTVYVLDTANSRVFSEVLIWNGLLGGWDSQIKDWVKDIYKIDLDVCSDSMMVQKSRSV